VKLLLWLVKLYPRAWRERYETEMVALLEEHTITLFTLIDLLFDALDARLDPHYRTQRMLSPDGRIRRIHFTNSTILCIVPLFWLCWQAFLSVMSAFIVNGFDPTTEISSMLFLSAFGVMIVAVLVIGFLVSFTNVRRITSKRNVIVRFFPLACFLFAFITYCLAANNGPANSLVFTNELLVNLLLTSIIITRGKISKRSLLPSFVLTTLVTVVMIAQLIDIASWSSSLLQSRGTMYIVSFPSLIQLQRQ